MSALASLTATYTDSEGEEDMEEGQSTPEDRQREPSEYKSLPTSPNKAVNTNDARSSSAPSSPKQPRLVSYNDDALASDEEPSSPTDDTDKDDMRRLSMETDTDENALKSEHSDTEDGSLIPPEPTGKCPHEIQEKIIKYYDKMTNEGLDMNKFIQDRKSFRNPSIYEKLIQFCNINELDTNYPPEIYDPLRWGKESYFDELSKVQAQEMEKRERERKEKLSKIEFSTGMVKKSDSDDEKKRKSKWDQAGPNSSSSTKGPIKPAGLVQASLTSSASGTKGTVISAFGTLAKKPRV